MWSDIEQFWDQYGASILKVLIALAIAVAIWLAAVIISRKLFPWLEKKLDAKKHPIPNQLIIGFRRPFSLFLKAGAICTAILLISMWLTREPLSPGLLSFLNAVPSFMYKLLRILAIVCVTWGLVAASNISFLLMRRARHKLDLHMSRSVSRFLAAVFNVVVIIIGSTLILEEMGFDVKALIAGLGIGGLTIALAAKDSASNFFGGLVLVTEKPFEIGDQVTCSGVEGVVEDITLRSTKIRTQPGSLTIVPNANISGSNITNWSGNMEKRRADFTLGLTYDATVKQMRSYISAVRAMLENDPEVVTDSVIVRFADLGESSLDIRVVFYTSLPGIADHLRIRERINFALLDIAQQCGVEFAFPTREIYLQEQPEPELLPPPKKKLQPVQVVEDGGAPAAQKTAKDAGKAAQK